MKQYEELVFLSSSGQLNITLSVVCVTKSIKVCVFVRVHVCVCEKERKDLMNHSKETSFFPTQSNTTACYNL